MPSPFLIFDVKNVDSLPRPEVLSDRVWEDLKGNMKLCPWLSFRMNQNTEETLVIDGDTELITISNAKDVVLFLIGCCIGVRHVKRQ